MARRWKRIEVPATALVEAWLAASGVPGWEEAEDRLRFYLSPEQCEEGAVARLQATQPADTDWCEDWTDEEDWAEGWKQYFKPTQLTLRLAVCPTWETWSPPEGVRCIVMDPGMAFGTGGHATTRMCLQLLEQHVSRPRRVLDIGTGSGILGIGALHLGAEHVTGTDSDPLCIPIARENFLRNGYGPDRVTVELQEGFAPGQFDLIFGNLVTMVLLALAPDVPEHLTPGGVFIGSGTIVERLPEVLGAMQSAGLSLMEARTEGEWAALAVKRV
ncbi:MAG: 50S ribosomal protein L11 methyltransferase [Candidatus Xenobia bacterium]